MPATVNLAPLAKLRFVDNNGVPLASGKVFTYAAGSTTKQATYTDASGATPNANPVILDSRGEAAIWFDQSLAYKIVLAPATDTDPPTTPIWTVDNIPAGAALLTLLASTSDATQGAGALGFNQALNYVARTVGASLIDRGVDLMNYITSQTERAAIKAGTSTTDHAAEFAAAFILAKRVFVPAGSWRLQSTVSIPSGCSLEGASVGATSINAYGCDAFNLAAGASLLSVSKLGVFSFTSLGIADPRTFDAFLCNGASGNLINYVTLRDLYIQGFADAINWRYTWNSRIDNVTTINCNFGVQVVGQSVNDSISGSRLIVNGGTASIHTSQVGSDTPEGLTVSDTLLSSGNYGVKTDGSFLSMQLTNCVLDLISVDAINVTDSKELTIVNCWMYAASGCVRILALGSPASEGTRVIGNTMHLTGASGRVVEQQGANIGIVALGNHLIHGGTSIGVYLDGQAAMVDDNYHENIGSGVDVILNSSASTHRVGKGTRSDGAALKVTGGFGTPEYVEGTWTVTDQSGAGLTITNTNQATYVKNGKQVTCTMDITFPATANGSAARLSLPFQPDAGSAWAGSIALQQPLTTQLQPNAGVAAANFVLWKPATQAFATNADLTGAHLIVSFTYRAIS